MAIFGPRATLFMNMALFAAAGLLVFLLVLVWVVPVMGYNTQESYIPTQPVPFSHKHHVEGLGLQCQYCHTSVHFTKQVYQYTPAIEGDFWYGHHYEMFRMAATFRDMVRTRKEPIPHQEILEVTAIVHAAAQSLKEKSRLVSLTEVMK